MKTSVNDADSRSRTIIRTSVVGIAANAVLAAVKAVIGVLSGSIAITLDAVNNISDAASSVITIIGTALAGRQPDKKHPFGYGRVEYLTAMVIAVLVLYAGVTSFVESVKKIISPEAPDYSLVALVSIGAAVVVKFVLGRYVRSVGKRVNSDSLVNSGDDAALDSVISLTTLVAAVIYLTLRVSLEAWLGALISLVIIKSGFEMLRETVSRLLGERGDAALAAAIKASVCSFDEVHGAYDLILNNYGPDSWTGSVHIEARDTLCVGELDALIRRITAKVYAEHGVILTAIGVYSENTTDEGAAAMRERIGSKVLNIDGVLEMHGFYVDEKAKHAHFDAVISLAVKDRAAVYAKVAEAAHELYPEYSFEIALDTDFSEE